MGHPCHHSKGAGS